MNETMQQIHDDQQRLARDLRSVVTDAEALLQHTVEGAGQGYAQARERLEKSLHTAKSQLLGMEQAVLHRAHDAGKAADRYVHLHPWHAVGWGAGFGLLVGFVLGRR